MELELVLVRKRNKKKEPLTDEEERQLWQSGVFGMETAESLLNVVYYYSGKLFGGRGGSMGESPLIILK